MTGHVVQPVRSLYIAGSSDPVEMARARMAMEAAREFGFQVTADWVSVIELAGGDGNPRAATLEQRRRWAHADLEGVKRAHFFWLLFPEQAPGRGAFFEFGVAWMSGATMVVSGNHEASIFSALADMRAPSDEAALALIVQAAQEMRLHA